MNYMKKKLHNGGQEPDPKKIKALYDKYIVVDAPEQVNISADVLKKPIDDTFAAGKTPKLEDFYAIANETVILMKTNELSRFQKSAGYRELDARYHLDDLKDKQNTLLQNHAGLDITQPAYREKVANLNVEIGKTEMNYYLALRDRRTEITKNEQVMSSVSIGDLEHIKSIDAMLSENEYTVREMFKDDANLIKNFEKILTEETESGSREKIESALFKGLLQEREQLMSAIDANKPRKELEAIEEKLKKNEEYIRNRFRDKGRKSSEQDKEKIDTFEERLLSQKEKIKSAMREQDASSNFDFEAFIRERTMLLAELANEPDDEKSILIQERLLANETVIRARIEKDKENKSVYEEKMRVFEQIEDITPAMKARNAKKLGEQANQYTNDAVRKSSQSKKRSSSPSNSMLQFGSFKKVGKSFFSTLKRSLSQENRSSLSENRPSDSDNTPPTPPTPSGKKNSLN